MIKCGFKPIDELYLEFHTNFVAGRKTPIITVTNRFSNIKLGEIVYYPGWRRYVYAPEPKTIYHDGCMNQITDFIRSITKMRREKQNGY